MRKYIVTMLSSLLIISTVLTSCTSSSTSDKYQLPAPGIGYLSIQMLDLDEEAAGIDMRTYARTLYQDNEFYSKEHNLIYYYDVNPPTTQGQPAITSAGTYVEMPKTEDSAVTWKNLPSGMHTFSVQVVNPDYSPLDPPVVIQILVTIPSEILQKSPAFQSITVQISPQTEFPSLDGLPPTGTPAAAANLGYDLIMGASVYSFRLNDDKIGQANVSGEGHFIYYMDANPPTTQGRPAITDPGKYKVTADASAPWIQVQPGTHTFSVQLVNNDNTPLNPVVLIETTTTLPELSY